MASVFAVALLSMLTSAKLAEVRGSVFTSIPVVVPEAEADLVIVRSDAVEGALKVRTALSLVAALTLVPTTPMMLSTSGDELCDESWS